MLCNASLNFGHDSVHVDQSQSPVLSAAPGDSCIALDKIVIGADGTFSGCIGTIRHRMDIPVGCPVPLISCSVLSAPDRLAALCTYRCTRDISVVPVLTCKLMVKSLP
jgi:hypothetical protein